MEGEGNRPLISESDGGGRTPPPSSAWLPPICGVEQGLLVEKMALENQQNLIPSLSTCMTLDKS